MGRFSPTVLPTAAPSFVENLAKALSEGLHTKQVYDQQRIANEDRTAMRANEAEDRTFRRTQATNAASRLADEDARNGIMPAGWTPPTEVASTPAPAIPGPAPMEHGPGPGMEEPGGFSGLASVIGDNPDAMQPPAPPAPRSSSGHPGGYDRVSGRFIPVQRMAPQTLPSGKVYDPNVQNDQKLAQAMNERQAIAAQKESERQGEVSQRTATLNALRGTKGYEGLTDAMIAASASDPTLFQSAVKNEPRAYHPTTLAEVLQEAEGRSGVASRQHARDRNYDIANPIKDPNAAAALKAPSDGQITSGMFASRMQSAEQLLGKYEAKGKPGLMTATAGGTPFVGETLQNMVASKDQQLYKQAQEDWVRAKLRKESGAAISPAEMEQEKRTYFPQLFDGEDVVKQKAERRAEAVRLLRTSSGNAQVMFPGTPTESIDAMIRAGKTDAEIRAAHSKGTP